MSFSDIFKSSYLENLTEFSFVDSAIALVFAFIIGMFIYFIYKKTFSGVMYSKSFNASLVLLTMLTTFIILAVTSNVVLSLGMVGALSIVRFRTAIKDPLDLVFLFWAIGCGIVLGAGMLPLAIVGSVLIGIVLIGFISQTEHDSPYILILDLVDESTEIESLGFLKKKLSKMKVKSKTITNGEIELIYEIRLKTQDTAFVNELASLKGVKNATLVSYNGEYAA
ncbi:MAG: DUF4956 domain-containing protein [Clostridiaceae bacterium]